MASDATANRRVVLAARPSGVAQSEHFVVSEAPVESPADGEILVRNHVLSVDPVMRWWLSDGGGVSTPVAIGDVARSLAVGEVVASNCEAFRAGDMVVGWFGWQDYARVGADAVLRKIVESDLPASLALGILGINGVTAYLGLTEVGRPKAGETVLVTAAAGAVGSAVGQIARILGCRTVGITGTDAKVALCRDVFGFDTALNYRADRLLDALPRGCPNGIDVFFDNVAGPISDIVLRFLALQARVIVSGTVGVSNWSAEPQGPRLERLLLSRRARIEGFVVFDHMHRYEGAVAQLAEWVRTGQLHYREDVLEGLDAAPDALAGLYRGDNSGKRVIRLV